MVPHQGMISSLTVYRLCALYSNNKGIHVKCNYDNHFYHSLEGHANRKLVNTKKCGYTRVSGIFHNSVMKQFTDFVIVHRLNVNFVIDDDFALNI